MEKVVLTVQEVQQLTGLGKNTVYQMVNRADFPKLRVGKRILIPCDAFMRWLEAQTENVS